MPRTDIALGAGLKSGVFQVGVPNQSEDTVFGTGLGLLVDIRHKFHTSDNSELALVSSGRVGFLTGEWEFGYAPIYALPNSPGGSAWQTFVVEDDADMVISETSLGLEWRRDLGWSVLTLRAQYEAQLWNTDVTDDLTFTGGAVKAGLSW